MAASMFSYNITRPYPFRWLTPVALIGGIILLILLSVMNFVQNSYTLAVEYSDNPNATIVNGIWYNRWPSYLTQSVRPTCEPANIPVNTQISTNNTALSYTISSVFNGSDSSSSAAPSLTYLNNVIDSCKVTEIFLQFDGTTDQPWRVFAASNWNVQVNAFVTCGIWTPNGYTKVNLTALYNPITNTGVAVPGSSVFISRDNSTTSTFFWAEALLSGYWADVTGNKTYSTFSRRDLQIVKGVAWLYANKAVTDINSLSFFNLAYNFGSTIDTLEYIWEGVHPLQYSVEDGPSPQIPIWPSVDRLGKSMVSAILADLGQTTSKSRDSSILADEAALQIYSSDFQPIYTELIQAQDDDETHGYILTTDDYDTRKSQGGMAPVRFSPAVISTKYLCQTPKLKSMGDIFISVLLADLVLLSAAWQLFIFAVDIFILRKRPAANHCEGCLKNGDTALEVLSNGAAPSHQRPERKWLRPFHRPADLERGESQQSLVGHGRLL